MSRTAEGTSIPVPLPVSLARDPRDVSLVGRLTGLVALLALALLASIAANIIQYLRKPDLVVVDNLSGAAVTLNNRELGETEHVRLDRDHIEERDKAYAARTFAEALYRVDPATRGNDVRRALELMVGESAVRFAKYLGDDRILETQRVESQQSTWEVQTCVLDGRDPWTVEIIGTQDLTRIVSGSPVTERHQLQLRIKLAADPEGRTDRNLRSGCRVVRYDFREIAAGDPPVRPDGGQALSQTPVAKGN